MIYYIYTLSHPISNEIRYVGKTINLKRRYKQHLYDKRLSHKASWVKSLRNNNLKPILTVLEECTVDNWEEREIYWISQFDNLTNHTKGGNGNSDYVRIITEETRNKIGLAHKGKQLSEEHKKKLKKSSVKRKIIIDCVEYESVMEASRILNINNKTIFARVQNQNFPNYSYA